MGNPPKAWAAISLAVGLAAAGRSAHAGVVELPTSRLDVDLPYQWVVVGGDHASHLDQLHDDGEGDVFVGATDASCATLWDETSAVVGALETFAPSWLPSGWEGRHWGGDRYGFCKWLGAFGVGATLRDTIGNAADWAADNDFATLLGVLDDASRRSEQGRRGTPVTLPGTAFDVQLPLDTFLERSSPADREDVLILDQRGATAHFEVYRASGGCADAAAAKAPGAIRPKSYYAGVGWTTYDVVGSPGRLVYCSEDTGATIVVVGATEAEKDAVGNAVADDFVLSALHGEREPVTALGELQTLPVSGWKVHVPTGWVVNPPPADGSEPEAGRDRLEQPDQFMGPTATLERSTAPCADAIAGWDTKPYDPLWLPSGWVASTATLTGERFCATVDGASLLVATQNMDAGMARRLLAALLVDLLASNSPAVAAAPTDTTTAGTSTSTAATAPSRARHPHLPWPLDVSLQTLAVGSDRGWGARIGLGADKYLNERAAVGVRGELGLDSANQLSYDVGASLALALTQRLYALGLGGLDQYGSVDQQQIAGALYSGVGGRYGLYEREGHLGLEVAYVWRAGSDGLDAAYPSHEWRVKADLQWLTSKLLTGLSAEYRGVGDANAVMLGVKLRL